MRPDTGAGTDPTTSRAQAGRAARLTRAVSLATFLSAAACMVLAGALHSAGRLSLSALLATSGYALGVAGITVGVLALALDQTIDSPTSEETP
jgi:hypothetical protein